MKRCVINEFRTVALYKVNREDSSWELQGDGWEVMRERERMRWCVW